VHHSRTKHIEIRHHFIREQVSNGICEIKFIESEKQLVDFFTKPLAKDRFNYLRTELGIWITQMLHKSKLHNIFAHCRPNQFIRVWNQFIVVAEFTIEIS